MGEKPEWVQPLGHKIREMTDARMWTPTTLAAKAGVTYKTITRIIDDEYARGPDLGTLKKVLAVFGDDGVQALREVGKDSWADTLAAELAEPELDEPLRRQIEAYVRDLWADLNKSDK